MNHQQERLPSTGQAKSMPALLPIVAGSIFSQHQLRIYKNDYCRTKVDSMLNDMDSILVFVPLELHVINTIVYTQLAKTQALLAMDPVAQRGYRSSR